MHKKMSACSLAIFTTAATLGLLSGPALAKAQTRAGGGLIFTSGEGQSSTGIYGEAAGHVSEAMAVVGRGSFSLESSGSLHVGGGARFHASDEQVQPYAQFLIGYAGFSGGGSGTTFLPGGGVFYQATERAAIQMAIEYQIVRAGGMNSSGFGIVGGISYAIGN